MTENTKSISPQLTEAIDYLRFLIIHTQQIEDTIHHLSAEYEPYICMDEYDKYESYTRTASANIRQISRKLAAGVRNAPEEAALLRKVNKAIADISQARRYLKNAIDFAVDDSEMALALGAAPAGYGDPTEEMDISVFHLLRLHVKEDISHILDTPEPRCLAIRLRRPGKTAARQVLLWTAPESLEMNNNIYPLLFDTTGKDTIRVTGPFIITGKWGPHDLVRSLATADITAFVEMWDAHVDRHKAQENKYKWSRFDFREKE